MVVQAVAIVPLCMYKAVIYSAVMKTIVSFGAQAYIAKKVLYMVVCTTSLL